MKPDDKAALASIWSEAAQLDLSELRETRCADGVSMWVLGRGVCVLESVRDDAPGQIHYQAWLRALSNLLGRCPSCGGVMSTETRGMLHEPDCPVTKTVKPEHLVNPDSTKAIRELLGQGRAMGWEEA